MQEIGCYIAYTLKNPIAAKNHLAAFHDGITRLLANNPSMFKVIGNARWDSVGIRRFRVRNYYIYYWIDEDRDSVYVTDVIYAGSEQMKHLNDMPMN